MPYLPHRRLSFFLLTVLSSFPISPAKSSSAVGKAETTALEAYNCSLHDYLQHYTLADPFQCDRFARCDLGKMTVELCPPGHAYDHEALPGEECRPLSQVNCVGRPVIQQGSEDYDGHNNLNCPDGDGDYEIPGTCNRWYFHCEEGRHQAVECPQRTIFDKAAAANATTPCVASHKARQSDCFSVEYMVRFYSCSRPHGHRGGDIQVLDEVTGHLRDVGRLRMRNIANACHFTLCLWSGGIPLQSACPKKMTFDEGSGQCVRSKNPFCTMQDMRDFWTELRGKMALT